MSRRGTLVVILVMGVVLGALREFLFVNLNYQIDHVMRSTDVSYAHSAFQEFVSGWSLATLLRSKWATAVLFIALMLGLALLFARVMSGSHRHAGLIVLGFIIIAGTALLLNLLSTWIPALELAAVKLLHLLQYPVLLFFVWAGLTLRGSAAG